MATTATIEWLRDALAAEKRRADAEKARADDLQAQLDDLKASIGAGSAPPPPPPATSPPPLPALSPPPPPGQDRPILANMSANVPARKRKRDDDEDEERTLAALWHEEGGAAQNAEGKTVPGRRRISGRQKIANKAEKTLARAQRLSNSAAEALGLGPCLRDNEAQTARGDRPIAYFEVLSRSGQGKAKRNGTAMLYHVTWCYENDQPPPKRLQYSHRCHDRTCVAPKHGHWETAGENCGRNGCEGGPECGHLPSCVPRVV